MEHVIFGCPEYNVCQLSLSLSQSCLGLGGLGFEFCVFVAGWRHALWSEWPFIIIIIIIPELILNFLCIVIVVVFMTSIGTCPQPSKLDGYTLHKTGQQLYM